MTASCLSNTAKATRRTRKKETSEATPKLHCCSRLAFFQESELSFANEYWKCEAWRRGCSSLLSLHDSGLRPFPRGLSKGMFYVHLFSWLRTVVSGWSPRDHLPYIMPKQVMHYSFSLRSHILFCWFGELLLLLVCVLLHFDVPFYLSSLHTRCVWWK